MTSRPAPIMAKVQPSAYFGTITLAAQIVLEMIEKIFGERVPWWQKGDAHKPYRISWKQEGDGNSILHVGKVMMPHCASTLMIISVRVAELEDPTDRIVRHAYAPTHVTVFRPSQPTLELCYYPNGFQLMNPLVCLRGDHAPEWIADARVHPSMTETRKRYAHIAAGQVQLV